MWRIWYALLTYFMHNKMRIHEMFEGSWPLANSFCRISAINEAVVDNVLTNYESINVYNEQVLSAP